MVQESELENVQTEQPPSTSHVSFVPPGDTSRCDVNNVDEDDSDDEPIVRSKPKNVHRSILDDSDDEAIEMTSMVEKEKSEDEEEEEVVVKRRVKRIEDSSDEEEEEAEEGKSLPTSQQSQSSSLQDEAPTVVAVSAPVTSLAMNSDLFDAEMDDDESGKENGTDRSSGSESNSSEDENDAQPEMTEALRKRLAKGASKKALPKRKAAITAMETQKMKIHSESQRLVRETAVRLPYHEPQKLDLATILAKTRKKQELLGEKTRLLWKELPKDEEKLEKIEKTELPVVNTVDTNEENTETADGENISETTESTPATENYDELPDLLIETVPKEENEEIMLYIGPDTEQLDRQSPTPTPSLNNRVGLTPKLAALKVDSFIPKLDKGNSDFIDFDSEEESPEAPGMDDLLNRLVKHNKPAQKKAKNVQISTISKETVEGEGDKEELTLKSFTYHVEAESETGVSKPGAQLQNLKQQLKAKMRIQKRISREERVRLYQLENEEGFEGTRMEDDALDLEGELTDPSDSGSSGDEEEEEDYLDEEEEYGANEQQRESNPYLEMEADDDDEEEVLGGGGGGDEDTQGSLHLHLDSDSQQGGDEDDVVSLPSQTKFDVFNEDANADMPVLSQKSHLSDVSSVVDRPFINLSGETKIINEVENESQETNASILSVTDSMDDPNGSTLSSGQREKPNLNRGMTPELFTPSTKGSLSKFCSDLALPMDDSQELLSCSSLPAAQTTTRTQVEPTPMMATNESFRFDFDDISTQSQVLDEDGLFKVKSSQGRIKTKSRRQLLENSLHGEDTEATGEEEEDNPWALCSGRFPQDLCSNSGPPLSQNVQQSPPKATQGDMSQLFGMCSGKFVEDSIEDDPDSPIKIRKIKSRKAIVNDDDSNDSFCLDEEGKNEMDDDHPEELDSDEENVPPPPKFGGFLSDAKQGKLRQEFVEDEAQLSGSECDSDENFDIAEEDDVLELQDGDMDDVGSRKALHDQVNRLHLKSLIDSDKREIKLLQEMYLPDGDLHSEGQGRMRRFRWANVDDGTEQDMLKDSDGEEEKDEEAERESKWRMERFEREKFLAEQEDAQGGEEEDESPLLKLGKVVFKAPQSSAASQQPKSTEASTSEPSAIVSKPTRSAPRPANTFKIPRAGSFLSKGKITLAKIAEMSKPVSDKNLGGPKNSRGFVFSAQGGGSEEKSDKRSNPQVKRSTSLTSEVPNPKRTKFERSNTMPVKSIFNHM